MFDVRFFEKKKKKVVKNGGGELSRIRATFAANGPRRVIQREIVSIVY